MLSSLIGPSGGLIYHYRAFRFRRTFWRGFTRPLDQWLTDWARGLTGRPLVLVGGSGGYSFSPEFLSRFADVTLVDPDPLSRIIFEYRLRRVHWDRKNYFVPAGPVFESPSRLGEFFARYGTHAILFCNFLGQIRFLNEQACLDRSYTEWKKELSRALEGRSWASFHDRLSGEVEPKFSDPVFFPRSVENQELLELYPSCHAELLDHLTGDFAPDQPRTFLKWKMTPGQFHLIELVRSAPIA